MLRITFLLCLATRTLAQVIVPERCPSVSVVTDFDGPRYMGQWYEAEKYFAIFQLGGKCVTANYSLDNNGTIIVHNREINVFTGRESTITGRAKFSGNPSEARLMVTFPSLPVPIPAPYWVLGTDYDNWAVVWSCISSNFFSSRFAWLLTREQHPPPEIKAAAYAVFDMNNISKRHLLKTDQKNC